MRSKSIRRSTSCTLTQRLRVLMPLVKETSYFRTHQADQFSATALFSNTRLTLTSRPPRAQCKPTVRGDQSSSETGGTTLVIRKDLEGVGSFQGWGDALAPRVCGLNRLVGDVWATFTWDAFEPLLTSTIEFFITSLNYKFIRDA